LRDLVKKPPGGNAYFEDNYPILLTRHGSSRTLQLDRRLKDMRRKLVITILSTVILILVLPLLMVVLSTAEPVEAG